MAQTTTPLLVGTWGAAQWAIRFHERHGFALSALKRKTACSRFLCASGRLQLSSPAPQQTPNKCFFNPEHRFHLSVDYANPIE